jgi:arylsulfatase A-like enzyme
MKPLLALAGWLVLGLAGAAQPAERSALPVRPVAAVRRVVIISVDGLRPDCLEAAEAPVLHQLRREGASTLAARTVPAAVTLPAHVSMLTGVAPAKHRVESNGDFPLFAPPYPAVPTIFELATRAGYRTALVAGKAKFAALNRPGTIDFAVILSGAQGTDADVGAAAVAIIEQHRPDLLFIHFPGGDQAGHAHGWGSPEQLAAIAAIDVQVGAVLAALERAGLRASTAVIMTADHGGAGTAHGADIPGSGLVPWLVAGPGVRPGLELPGGDRPPVRIEDTAATACWLLGLDRPANLDGRPLTEAFVTGP